VVSPNSNPEGNARTYNVLEQLTLSELVVRMYGPQALAKLQEAAHGERAPSDVRLYEPLDQVQARNAEGALRIATRLWLAANDPGELIGEVNLVAVPARNFVVMPCRVSTTRTITVGD
jgi:hypothetical protein